MPHKLAVELNVLFAGGGVFRQGEVMHVLGLDYMSAGDKLAPSINPEIDIWRAASLMLKRYGEKALEESAPRADELFAEQDHDGAAVWRRNHRRSPPAR